MKRWFLNIDKTICKLVLIHFLFLLGSQFLVQADEIKPYVCKTVQYEGVYHQTFQKQLETLDHPS